MNILQLPEEALKLSEALSDRGLKMGQFFEQAIGAIASIVSVRDPYTAQHQMRVSQLCSRIAQEMKLPDNKIEGVRLAALIHDVGKLSVPSEILSKPGKLNEVEFKIIKSHCRVGYDIIKGIEFPWPVAQIILQHHERLNGSGYPSDLCGTDIIIEARVLAVADVVEAMSSYRPYRPAFAIEQALAEIEYNKGALYDAAAVEACRQVLCFSGFQFTSSDLAA